MITLQKKLSAALLTALVAATLAAPRPASADTASTAAIAGLAGIIVGSLLFDSSRNQYYYVNGGNRRYVNDYQARQWYQRRDPQYYNQHRGQWSNHQQFQANWSHSHHYQN